MVVLLLTTTLTLCEYATRVQVPFHFCGESQDVIDCTRRSIADSRRVLALGTEALCCVTVLGIGSAVHCALHSARRGVVLGVRSVAVSCAVLVFGLGAFFAT